MRPDERVYAGEDGRYYCKRNDGTTGLIVGGAAGGILGNVIDGGHSRILGTLLGGAAGALAGRAVEQNQQQVVCSCGDLVSGDRLARHPGHPMRVYLSWPGWGPGRPLTKTTHAPYTHTCGRRGNQWWDGE